MILALWTRWRTQRHARWLLLAAALLILDAFVGSTLIAWEIGVLRDVLR